MGLPVALHHGIFGFDELRLGPLRIPQFPGVARALTQHGFDPLLTRAHPVASIPRRAADLKSSLLAHLARRPPRPPNPHSKSERIILVAHSLGGLDARYMLTHLGMSRHVAALLTISTPHRGASLADFAHLHLENRLHVYSTLERLGLDIGAARDLTRARMLDFNARTPDHPDVAYFSITCSPPIPPSPPTQSAAHSPAHSPTHSPARQPDRPPRPAIRPHLLSSHRLIEREEGDNDGIVSVASARWGHHLAHWPIDHIDAINRPRLLPPPHPSPTIPPLYVQAVQSITTHLNSSPP